MVVPFQPRFQGPENGQGGFLPRLLHRHRPEPPLQGRVLFDIFPVFLPGGGPQHLQFSPPQGRLENIGGIDGSLRRSGAHDGMHLIHKQNHVAVCAGFPTAHPAAVPQTRPVLGACHQTGHVQTHQPFLLQLRRDIAHGHPLGKPLGNGRLSHPRLSHQGRVVLVLPAENANHHVNFLVPPDYRLHG